MKYLLFALVAVMFIGCEEPVPVEDVYQSEKEKQEILRQEKARVGSDGLNAVGCLPDDRSCIADKAKEALNKFDDDPK